MRIVGWILKATNTSSECVLLIAFPLQQWLHERISTLHCIRIFSVFYIVGVGVCIDIIKR